MSRDLTVQEFARASGLEMSPTPLREALRRLKASVDPPDATVWADERVRGRNQGVTREKVVDRAREA